MLRQECGPFLPLNVLSSSPLIDSKKIANQTLGNFAKIGIASFSLSFYVRNYHKHFIITVRQPVQYFLDECLLQPIFQKGETLNRLTGRTKCSHLFISAGFTVSWSESFEYPPTSLFVNAWAFSKTPPSYPIMILTCYLYMQVFVELSSTFIGSRCSSLIFAGIKFRISKY